MDISTAIVQATLVALNSTSVIISDTASYQFNPSMSQMEGCKRAEERAKVKMLNKVYGQDFGADSSMSCRETDKQRCDSTINTYESTRGYIKSIISRAEKVEGWTCTVELKAEVQTIKKTKSSIDASAQLDRVVYLPSDTANVSVKTNSQGLVSVFKYDPIENVVTKVFPTGQPERTWTYFDRPLDVKIPLSMEERDTPYFLFVAVTDVPINMRDQYRLQDFYEMWDNQPNNNKYLVRKSFNIARSKL